MPHPRTIASLVLCAGLAGSVLPGATEREEKDGEESLSKALSIYTETLSLVGQAYVEETRLEELMAAATEGAGDALDPFSLYVPAREVEAYRAAKAVARDRSGLVLVKERGVVFVMAVDPGGPADRAGLEPGQIIETLEDRPTRGMPLWRARQLLAAPAGTRLRLVSSQPGGEKEELELELAEFEPARPEWRVEGEVPVLRIPGFSADTASTVASLLREHGGERLIVDLRGVAGGDAEQAYAVAELFAAGELGALVGRDGPIRSFAAAGEPLWQGRLIVLADRSTQGPAEILAAVLRQSADARLVGRHTFGHAGRVEPLTLASGALLELTTAFYAGPDLEPLDDSLEPDERLTRAELWQSLDLDSLWTP